MHVHQWSAKKKLTFTQTTDLINKSTTNFQKKKKISKQFSPAVIRRDICDSIVLLTGLATPNRALKNPPSYMKGHFEGPFRRTTIIPKITHSLTKA